MLVVSLKGLVAKTNWLAVNRQSWSNSDPEDEGEGDIFIRNFGLTFTELQSVTFQKIEPSEELLPTILNH
jgi:hypothetical protein